MMHPLPSGRLFAIVFPTSLLLLAAFFRLGELARNERLHPDEALYADLGRRVGLWGDWQLLNTPVDKPPLYFLTGGVFFRLLGDSEFTVRLPNAFASLVSLALLYRLTHRLTASRVSACGAGLLMALSPFDIAFAVSGFTDTQMMMYLLACLTFLSYQRWVMSGLAFGLAVAIKPAAFWYGPLIVAMSLVLPRPSVRQIGGWLASVGLVLLLISLWDRMGSLGSFWTLGKQNYATGRLIRSDELLPRFLAWAKLLGQTLPHWSFFMGGLLALAHYLYKNRQASPLIIILWLCLDFCLAYLGLHWLVAFNLFDRYLLLILPLLFILIGIALASRPSVLVILALASLLFFPHHSNLASDQDKHRGIDQLAAAMNHDFAGEVFYEHWLGWELRYYLTARPQVHHLYFASPDDLADYALEELARIPVPRYFVAPKIEAAPWVRRLERRGLRLEAVYDDERYLIFSVKLSLHTDAASFGYPYETCSG